MGKGAILSIVALRPRVQIGRAELRLVLIRVVKFFNAIVRLVAMVTIRALIPLSKVALFRLVRP